LNYRRVDLVEPVVVVAGIMMEWDQMPGPDGFGQPYRLLDRAVSPADVRGILVIGVLGIMNEQIRFGHEAIARCPLSHLWETPTTEGRLMIG